MSYFRADGTIRAIFGEKAYRKLVQLLDPCCGDFCETVKACVQDTRPYKSYTVVITTPGGSQIPNINYTLENTIGDITWSYINTGQYRLTLNGAFTTNKTIAYVLNDITNLGSASFYLANNNYIDLFCIDMSGNPINNLLYSAVVEIRVYN